MEIDFLAHKLQLWNAYAITEEMPICILKEDILGTRGKDEYYEK